MTKVNRTFGVLLTLLVMASSVSCQRNNLQKAGWTLGVQSYTFHRFSFQKAIDKVHQLGLHHIEAHLQTVTADSSS